MEINEIDINYITNFLLKMLHYDKNHRQDCS